MNPELHVIVRTRYVGEVEELRSLGASEIIPEEFETSVEIFARVLENYHVPRNLVLDLIDRIRHDHYEVLRERHSPARLELPIDVFEDLAVETCLLRPDSPPLGKSLKDLDLRRVSGAMVIAVKRGDRRIVNPQADFQFAEGDTLFMLGDSSQLAQAIAFLDPTTETRDG